MTILGISAYFHDSSAALLIDGQIVVAALEERFSRVKHDNSFPSKACAFCLEYAGVSLDEIDEVVFFEKPFVKFERLIKNHLHYSPKGLSAFRKAMPIWLTDKLNMRGTIHKELKNIFGISPKCIKFSEHHLSHAALSYYLSGYKEAGILVIDAVGEWTTTSILTGKDGKLTKMKELDFPHSLGLLYSSFTQFLGFAVNSDEYKVMGLAPYGKANDAETTHFIDIIKNRLINIEEDGSFAINDAYFTFMYGLKMIDVTLWTKLFGIGNRKPKEAINQHHCNLAFAIQTVTTEIISKLIRHTQAITGYNNICIAGGCALNCSAIGQIKQSNKSINLFIPYAPDDGGCSIGAALALYYSNHEESTVINTTPYLGPQYKDAQVESILKNCSISYELISDFDKLTDIISKDLSEHKVVGWFQGRMEFGPRALGNRSILADPRWEGMKDHINSVIKFREGFRPFAPAILEEQRKDFFDGTDASPYMNCTYELVKDKQYDIQCKKLEEAINIKNSCIPAVTHIDWTSRIQTVSKETNERFYKMLQSFYKFTGCPLLLNTSFNVMGEPIVCTPTDAIKTFNNSGIDILVINNYIIKK